MFSYDFPIFPYEKSAKFNQITVNFFKKCVLSCCEKMLNVFFCFLHAILTSLGDDTVPLGAVSSPKHVTEHFFLFFFLFSIFFKESIFFFKDTVFFPKIGPVAFQWPAHLFEAREAEKNNVTNVLEDAAL